MNHSQEVTQKENIFHLWAAATGSIIPLEEVPDDVFSQKMIGEGYAIIPAGGNVLSPIEGKLTNVADAHHAYYIENDQGFKVLVHVGLDTLMLDGEGFHTTLRSGMRIEKGDTLVEVDWSLLKDKGYNTVISIVVIENGQTAYNYELNPEADAVVGETIALTFRKK
ncbi:PTS sugar transporter subunit IIA [Lacticigenium naphthae]|uniref:PTS sugar transporter subunit IIA n=1 Tax=Lacticigenium naphthae TaxID=515351 RepID=UPI0004095058|nr:glucose PTS transporter subunit IIA [Lacticigenium naphthae]